MRFAVGLFSAMARNVLKFVARLLCMPLTKNIPKLSFQRLEFMRRLWAYYYMRAEMDQIKIWFKLHHRVVLLVACRAPVTRKRSARDSPDFVLINRIINLSCYSPAWHASETLSEQTSDTELVQFCHFAGCLALVCRILWAVSPVSVMLSVVSSLMNKHWWCIEGIVIEVNKFQGHLFINVYVFTYPFCVYWSKVDITK